MQPNLTETYDRLFAWCEAENFAGYDPFDGLNSRIFQATPLKYLSPARLAWLQMVKRSAKNLRPQLKVEKDINSKGIALFALAELSRFRMTLDEKHKANAKRLLEVLLSLKIEIQNPTPEIQTRTAFGYNFDWQSRAFFAPRGTPTIVPTAFAARAFLEADALFKAPEYLTATQEICRFIIADLNRPFESADEVCFSYTPLDTSVIYNASLLAGETLAVTGALTHHWESIDLAVKSARFVARRQRDDGAWAYGSKLRHAWVDNFHTAYILLSLFRLQKTLPDLTDETAPVIGKGLNFWLNNFFLDDGTPKYYDRETFPVDIHSASAAIIALCELNELDARCLPLAEKVATWTIENMRDESGFFYYQKRKLETVKIPFIRWAQAWTVYAIARLIESRSKKVKGKNLRKAKSELIDEKSFDIRERSFEFAASIVKLCQYLEKEKIVSKVLIQQLMKLGTSIGANLEEGQAGQSTADFISKNTISLEEARETNYWLRLILATTTFNQKIESRLIEIRNESEELMKIIASIIVSTKKAKTP